MAQATAAASIEPVADLFPATSPFIVLGSVRQQEERQIAGMMAALLERMPGAVIGLFPRHMERLVYWQMMLAKAGLPWQFRSRLSHPAKAGSIIVWDRFGELAGAYRAAKAAFVGGSLMPLGGQNFLEPLQAGILPVIGPHWDNFHWVGPEIVAEGLLQVAADWQSAVGLLAQTVAGDRSRADIRAAAQRYIAARRGGARQACDLVLKYLQGDSRLPRAGDR
jgi:3-deoxy-D-manno-octulosonic-acid transferase